MSVATLRNHYDQLVALAKRMGESPARNRVIARAEEAFMALRNQPVKAGITRNELSTAYRFVFEQFAVSKSEVANHLDTTPTRAGNIMRKLEDADLVTSTDVNDEAQGSARRGQYKELVWQCWQTHDDTSAEESQAIFDAKFPLSEEKELTREREASTTQPSGKRPGNKTTQHKEATMASSTQQFTKATDKQSGAKFTQVAHMIKALRAAKDPISFDQLCKDAGAKYPQDVQAAMFALEVSGMVDRYTYVEDGSTRSRVAYAWTQGNGNPTGQATSASPKRSRSTKKSQPTETRAAAGAE